MLAPLEVREEYWRVESEPLAARQGCGSRAFQPVRKRTIARRVGSSPGATSAIHIAWPLPRYFCRRRAQRVSCRYSST